MWEMVVGIWDVCTGSYSVESSLQEVVQCYVDVLFNVHLFEVFQEALVELFVFGVLAFEEVPVVF